MFDTYIRDTGNNIKKRFKNVMNHYKNMYYSATAALTIFIVVLSVFSSPAIADEFNDKVGTRTYSFLKRVIGARASALGGAFTGMSDDESALYYNPAGIQSLAEKRVMFSYQNYIAGINAGFLSYITPRGEDQSYGVYLNYINYGKFIRTEKLTGTELGTFGATSLVFGATHARQLSPKLQAGVTLKAIYANWDTFTSAGAAVDFGFRYTLKRRIVEFPKRGFGYIGLSVLHLGKMLSAFTVNSEKEPIPTQFRLGIGGRARGLPVVLLADIIAQTDNDMLLALGVEYTDIRNLALRAGWNSAGSNFQTDNNGSALAGFSFGLGFKVNRLNIDYSLSPMNDLGEAHRVTISHRFGEELY
ncbi:PorV/PorQ family protein [Gemmatimonas aurantiaca]|nr:PorV/PorQ family protein [Gemmatimonas aurantiaca]